MVKQLYGSSKKYHYIYKTTNLVNKKYYIGMHSTNNLNDEYMGSGTLLKRSLNKYGKENHSIEILEYVNSREELVEKEKEIVSLQEIAKKECMNLSVGGSGGIHNEDHYNKFVKGPKNLINWQIKLKELKKDEIWCTNFKNKIKLGLEKSNNDPRKFLGKNHSNETKQKMSETKKGTGKGENNSQHNTMWITNGKESKKIKKTDNIPTTWYKGRKP